MIFSRADKFGPEDLEDPEALARARIFRAKINEAWEHRDQTLGEDYPSIRDFYRGRHVFITGASGFVGKVILEKLLRHCTEIGNIYILMRPRRGQDPETRLKAILEVPLFDRLRQENPSAMQKVIPILGDCMTEGLGISEHNRQVLIDRVSVVYHSAASVRFTDPIAKSAALNTRSTSDIVQLARQMRQLKVLIHVSTAYCFTNHNPTAEHVYPTEYDWRDVLKYCKLPDAHALDLLGPKFMGFQPNSYVFTKALAERVMEEAAEDLPVVIVRPSIVTCALEDPLPGWMDNLNGFAMFWALVSKGVFRIFYTHNKNLKFDLIPVDFVSNGAILASWAKGTGQPVRASGDAPGKADVVNLTAGDVKPSTYFMMQTVLRTHRDENKFAYPGVVRFPDYYITTNKFMATILAFFYHIVFGTIVDTALVAFNKKPMLMPVYRKVAMAFAALDYFQKAEFRFESTNFWRLVALQHPSERKDLDFNVHGLKDDWMAISRNQLAGVCKYALREPIDGPGEMAKNWKHIQMLWWAEACWYALLIGLGVMLMVWRFG